MGVAPARASARGPGLARAAPRGTTTTAMGGCTDDACLPSPAPRRTAACAASMPAGPRSATATPASTTTAPGLHDRPVRPEPVRRDRTGLPRGGRGSRVLHARLQRREPVHRRGRRRRSLRLPRRAPTACSCSTALHHRARSPGACGGGSASCDDARPGRSTPATRSGLRARETTGSSRATAAHAPSTAARGRRRHCDGRGRATTRAGAPASSAACRGGRRRCAGCVTTRPRRRPGRTRCAVARCATTPRCASTSRRSAAGTSCSDGIYCTTGDVCDGTGACRGTVSTDCGAPAVCSARRRGPGLIDVSPAAHARHAALRWQTRSRRPPSSPTVDLFLRARDTGVLHFIERVDFSSTWSGAGYPVSSSVRAATARSICRCARRVRRRLHPWHQRSEPWTFDHYPTDNYAWGHRVLRDGVVIGPGTNTLDIDVAPARVTGACLYAGTTRSRRRASTPTSIFSCGRTTPASCTSSSAWTSRARGRAPAIRLRASGPSSDG